MSTELLKKKSLSFLKTTVNEFEGGSQNVIEVTNIATLNDGG